MKQLSPSGQTASAPSHELGGSSAYSRKLHASDDVCSLTSCIVKGLLQEGKFRSVPESAGQLHIPAAGDFNAVQQADTWCCAGMLAGRLHEEPGCICQQLARQDKLGLQNKSTL